MIINNIYGVIVMLILIIYIAPENKTIGLIKSSFGKLIKKIIDKWIK